jgi:hypothetical protein
VEAIRETHRIAVSHRWILKNKEKLRVKAERLLLNLVAKADHHQEATPVEVHQVTAADHPEIRVEETVEETGK